MSNDVCVSRDLLIDARAAVGRLSAVTRALEEFLELDYRKRRAVSSDELAAQLLAALKEGRSD